jgi:hypothetical protein
MMRATAKAMRRRADERRPIREHGNGAVNEDSPDCPRLPMSPCAAAVSIQLGAKSPILGFSVASLNRDRLKFYGFHQSYF